MKKFKLITDSSCDISVSLLEERDIDFVPFYISFDGVSYYKEHIEMKVQDFYDKMLAEKAFPKTSLPSVYDYTNAFRPYLESGTDVLCICLTSKFSGSYQSAVNAKAVLDSEYPDRTIAVIDSYSATAGQGLLVLEAAKMRDAGYSIKQCAETVEKLKLTVRLTFTVDSLEHLKRGGRIGAASAFAGSLLNIKPIIQVANGELHPHSKVRGRKKAISEIIDIVTVKEINGDKDMYEFYLLAAQCRTEALELEQRLKDECGITVSLPISEVGVTIGCHIGPSAIGMAAIRKYDTI